MDERVKDIEQVADLIRGIRVAMLTTLGADGEMHSRPMATQDLDFDGTLWFFTSADSEKAEELARDPRVAVSYVDEDRRRYISLSGMARLVRLAGVVKGTLTGSGRPAGEHGRLDVTH